MALSGQMSVAVNWKVFHRFADRLKKARPIPVINSLINRDQPPTEFHFLEQKLWLDPLCAMYWEEEDMLVISDLHLGKSGHFRRNGTPLPSNVGDNNHWNLALLIDRYSPEKVLLLGDLFHSEYNEEWDQFLDLKANYPDLKWILVKGNHDILDETIYSLSNLEVVDVLYLGPFCFVHEPEDLEGKKGYGLAGHIHPCVRLSGKARQSLRLKCFWFGKSQGVLPAFGDFTGSHRIVPKKGDDVYVVAGDVVRKV